MDSERMPVAAYPQNYVDALYKDVAATKSKLDNELIRRDASIDETLAHLDE